MELNEEIRKVLKSLLELPEPEIILKGNVDSTMEDYVFWALSYLTGRNSPPVRITIDSPGGSTVHGCNIYDLIVRYKGKVTGIGVHRAHSAASFIMQACDVRQMTTHAEMVIHNPSRVSVSLDELVSQKRLTALIADLRRSQNKLVAIYVKRTGKTEREIKIQLAKDEDLTAAEAKAFGLIDEIVG